MFIIIETCYKNRKRIRGWKGLIKGVRNKHSTKKVYSVI